MAITDCRHAGSCRRVGVRQKQRGFTLVELVLVIALSGIVAVMIGTVLSRPLQGFVDQSRRAQLTDLAATALSRMARDLRLAVPNSVREHQGGLALLPIHEAGRYRESLGGTLPMCDADSCRLEVLTPLDADRVAESRWLVIYNVGATSGGQPLPGQNLWAYERRGVVTPQGASFERVILNGEQHVQVVGADDFRFAFASPQRRVYLAREAVRYRCEGDMANGRGTLWRETFDTLDVAHAPYSRAPLADSVSRCELTYRPGNHARNGFVTLRLSLTQDGETISLLQQVHVDNAP
ncbi:MAG: type II secretion system protein [Pseudomonas sp.]|nr:type II secretion system protein [Pseudomonas sp.]